MAKAVRCTVVKFNRFPVFTFERGALHSLFGSYNFIRVGTKRGSYLYDLVNGYKCTA